MPALESEKTTLLRGQASTAGTDSYSQETNTQPVAVQSPDLEDIWADDYSEHGHSSEWLSEIPRVRRQHETTGYREGVTVGKQGDESAQRGFDEGYAFGAHIGLRIGRVLGMLSEMGKFDVTSRDAYQRAASDLTPAEIARGLVEAGVMDRDAGATTIEGEDIKSADALDAWEHPAGWEYNLQNLVKWEHFVQKLKDDYSIAVKPSTKEKD